jgi:putative acetyltransferase
VAEEEGQIVGHILFSPVELKSRPKVMMGAGLAPMAVLPERQRQGIGSRLVRSGLDRLRDQSCPYVIVLGHPEYYPRFGFERASKYGITSQWAGVPDEAFMIIVFAEGAFQGVSGAVRYRAEFDAAI